MLMTSEVRWFVPGTPPEAIAHWFENRCPGEPVGTPESREDLYLSVPGCDYLNIKLRQERLEIKWRQAECGEIRFSDRSRGYLEKWQKCICEDLNPQIPGNGVASGTWVPVRKTRSQRTYQFLGDSVQPIPGDRRVAQGCTVELTHIQIRNRYWWSLGLEAFGEPDKLIENLQTTARFIWESFPNDSILSIQDSFAYPKLVAIAV